MREDDPLRCLIVDDESPARDELRYLLGEVEGVEVVGAAATAAEASVLVENVHYDIVFLDIHMPGMDGLELAATLRARPDAPAIVFTTAHAEHALDAFELAAVDYLLKPFDVERLAQSVERVRAQAASGDGDAAGPATVTRSAATPAGPRATRIPVQQGERTRFVDSSDVFVATAARGYSYLKLDHEKVLVSFSLNELLDRFGGPFVRVHRSHVVNLDRIAELRPDFAGALVVVMSDRDRTQVPVARRQASTLREQLGL